MLTVKRAVTAGVVVRHKPNKADALLQGGA